MIVDSLRNENAQEVVALGSCMSDFQPSISEYGMLTKAIYVTVNVDIRSYRLHM